jgi:excisionase family DNA binding protein
VKKLLTLAQTAERVQRSEKAIRMLIFRGKFPFTKVGGRVFVEETELEKYLTLARQTTAEEAVGLDAA